MPSRDATEDERSTLSTGRGSCRPLARSPHPYHRRSLSVVQQHVQKPGNELNSSGESTRSDISDHATDADDERGPILKTLPAPPLRARKGLKGHDSPVDPTPAVSPLPTPRQEQASFDFAVSKDRASTTDKIEQDDAQTELLAKYYKRRKAEIARRTTEFLILTIIAVLTFTNDRGTTITQGWIVELSIFLGVICFTYLAYPLLRTWKLRKHGWTFKSSFKTGFHIPSRFDPGPLLYPVFMPVIIAASVCDVNSPLLLSNMLLGLSSIPHVQKPGSISTLHWAMSLLPLSTFRFFDGKPLTVRSSLPGATSMAETLSLLGPMHQTLLQLINDLTTTSLDPAETQLLATGLANLQLLAANPQSEILKALLWIGGFLLYATCERALCWEVELARIPAWKFARNKPTKFGLVGRLNKLLLAVMPEYRSRFATSSELSGSDSDAAEQRPKRSSKVPRDNPRKTTSASGRQPNGINAPSTHFPSLVRSATFSTFGRAAMVAVKWRKAATATSSPLRRLTFLQARALKWLLAAFVYLVVILVIMLPIRYYVSTRALYGHEPFGWALGYLLADLQEVRMFVLNNDLEAWIILPINKARIDAPLMFGWVEESRLRFFGAANTRLLLSAYCVVIITAGLGVVLSLKSIVEVDTRRKVFHGVMVAMLLPTIPVDPCFFALALVVVLGVFLLLDLFRASQLPPISRPLTTFLAPYVDGRDHRGPVVVSHIFLLIGCAIPLWLSISNLPRTGMGPWQGWDIPHRDISMVSGVICVGMGDAAASLIGRRFGRTKWYWGGGKSLEGSVAFALAVTVGLTVSQLWLMLGGWLPWDTTNLGTNVVKAFVAGSGASMMESTLTAANDNVVVPIGLWLLVRALAIK